MTLQQQQQRQQQQQMQLFPEEEDYSSSMLSLEQQILSDITVFTKYARHLPEISRRETWDEIVDRNMNMHVKKYPELEDEIRYVYNEFVRTKRVLPSMRSMQFAGPAIDLANQRIYNCSFHHASTIDFFSETLLLLLLGCFHGDTLVETSEGPKPIKDITCDDEVLSFDENIQQFIWVNPVWAGQTDSKDKPKVKLTTDDGHEIIVTEDHLFLTKNRGWVECKDLTPDDDIISH